MNPWFEAAYKLWIGDTVRPYRDEFDYVLAVSDVFPPTDNGVRHKYLPIPVRPEEAEVTLDTAIGWLERRWMAGGTILVQSPGYRWAELVIAALYVHLGASEDEAISSLRRVRPEALSEPTFCAILSNWGHRHA